MIVDSDVLIWYLRGNEAAKRFVDANLPFSISVITYMELMQGMRSKSEMRIFQKHIHRWGIDIVHLDQDISARAMFYVQEYALSHAMTLADALIAATAVQNGETLATANDKHYKMIPSMSLKRFAPGA